MNCEKYLALSFQEQCVMIGQAVHLLQSDPESFSAMSSMIRAAAQQGKFDNVKIGHAEIAEREFPCEGCDVGEYIHKSTHPNGQMYYECNNCGDEVSYP